MYENIVKEDVQKDAFISYWMEWAPYRVSKADEYYLQAIITLTTIINEQCETLCLNADHNADR